MALRAMNYMKPTKAIKASIPKKEGYPILNQALMNRSMKAAGDKGKLGVGFGGEPSPAKAAAIMKKK